MGVRGVDRLLVRDVNLLLPPLLAVVIGLLAAFGWQRSDQIQHARKAAFVVSEESRLMTLVSANLREAEQAEGHYLAGGAAADLVAYRQASARMEALSAALAQRAAHDPLAGGMVFNVIRMLDARRQAMATEMLRRPAPPSLSVPASDPVLGRIGEAALALTASRATHLQAITDGIRTLRWLAVAVAGLGIVSVLSVFRLLRRAWRRLARAEGEQRRLAQQLRNSLDSLSQGVAVFSANGQLQTWNMRLQQMLDLPPDLLGSRLSYETLAGHLAADGPNFLEPLAAIRREALMDPRDGEHRPVVYERAVRQRSAMAETQIEIRRTLTPEGGFVLTLTDVTEHVRAERMLREAQKMQALGQLTGGIAHDFNNMLTVILGSLEISGAELSGSPGQQVAILASRMRRASQAAESGAALIRQLLGFARKQPVAPAPVELGALLPELMPLLRHSVGETVEIAFDAEPGLWPALADPAQLESAVLNLALNARDAMPRGGRLRIQADNVTVRASDPLRHPELAAGDYVRISVADTGQGMDRDVIARAFEPFFTTKAEGRGTGLGLAMVFGFARQSGGIATIDSAPGQGTRVTLFLPRVSALAPAEAPAAPCEPPGAAIRTGSPMHVLLVEDDPSVRDITAEILRGLGYRVSEAADAEQAKLAMQVGGSRVDLLLTDIMLPGAADGRELASTVRRGWPETRVLFMSGHIEGGAGAAGADEATQWIGKPFRRAQLAAKVDSLLGVRRTGRAA